MKKLIALILAAALAVGTMTGCGNGNPSSSSSPEEKVESAEEKKERTTLKSTYSSEITTFNYLKSAFDATMEINYNLQDALIDFDKYGKLIPCLAESWDISEDKTVYTFHLRDGINWSDWEGNIVAPIVAQDFVDGIHWILTKENASDNAKAVYSSVKNAQAYYEGTLTDFSQVGIRAIDEKTLEYTLIKPTPYFLTQLDHEAFYPVNGKFLEEQGENFGVDKNNMLYSGSYLLHDFVPQSHRTLVMNPNYWNKDIISIEKMNYKYNKEANAIASELFLRGEITSFYVPASILDDWMNDPEKKQMMHPDNLTNMSYWMAFNFDPHFDEEYNPEAWKIAVNNESFRKSIFYGVDREAAIMPMEPYNPKGKLLNTLSRKGLVELNGVDYTEMGGLDQYTNTDPFQQDKALEYKAKAMEELKGKVEFPVKVVMPHSTASAATVERLQIIEQQLENLLGTDYIDIVLDPRSGSGFNSKVRNPGNFALMNIGWGPDFMDPHGTFNPVLSDALDLKFGRVSMCEDLLNPDGTSKFEQAVAEAASEGVDLQKRYEGLAEAERMLLDHAVLIPFYTSGGGYVASYIEPFSGHRRQYGLYGPAKLKGAKILDHPVGMDEYKEIEEKFLQERAERMKED